MTEHAPVTANASEAQGNLDLVDELRSYALKAAPAPMELAALIFALAVVGGIASRSYNVAGTALNQYFVLVSLSSTGKGIMSKCFSKLIAEVAKKVPAVVDLKGFGYLASGPAIIKWLAKRPYPIAISLLDEIGHDLQAMASPTNIHAKTMEKVLLQMWPLGGAGNVFDPMAYSDTENNTKQLDSPALTIVGTTTPDTFNLSLTDNLASNGMLARLFVAENTGDIPPYNDAHETEFNALPERLIVAVATLAEQALKLAHAKEVRTVELTPEAKTHFTAYAEAQRVRCNATGEGAARQLRNRSHEKALKLAATIAVGKNPFVPCIDINAASWATKFLDTETDRQVAKYNNGEAGQVAGNETKQLNAVIHEIGNYFTRAFDDEIDPKFGARFDMHRDHVITQTYLSRKLIKTAAFKGSNSSGGTAALYKALKTLTDADDLRQFPKHQMLDVYKTTAVAFVVQNPTRFLKGGE